MPDTVQKEYKIQMLESVLLKFCFYSGGQHLDDARQYETEEARAGRLEGISG